MGPFEYFAPVDLAQACQLLAEYKGEAKILSGGQSLITLLKLGLIAPKYLIDIKGLKELDYLSIEDDTLKVGALATHRAVEKSELVKSNFPVISEMEQNLGSVQIRNWGTVAGGLCHADPAQDVAPVMVALGARVKAKSVKGERVIGIDNFFTDYLTNSLRSNEIVTEISIPLLPPKSGAVYLKESKRHGDFPICSVAVMVSLKGNTVKEIRIALGAAGPTVIRARESENLICKRELQSIYKEAAETAAQEASPVEDVEGTAEYKREMIKLLVDKAIKMAAERAKG